MWYRVKCHPTACSHATALVKILVRKCTYVSNSFPSRDTSGESNPGKAPMKICSMATAWPWALKQQEELKEAFNTTEKGCLFLVSDLQDSKSTRNLNEAHFQCAQRHFLAQRQLKLLYTDKKMVTNSLTNSM